MPSATYTSPRYYVVVVNGTERLVRAHRVDQAERHVAATTIRGHLATQADLVRLVGKVSIETAGEGGEDPFDPELHAPATGSADGSDDAQLDLLGEAGTDPEA